MTNINRINQQQIRNLNLKFQAAKRRIEENTRFLLINDLSNDEITPVMDEIRVDMDLKKTILKNIGMLR